MGKKVIECCVYWIRRPDHTDIFTEGYVGITKSFESRVVQHLKAAKLGKLRYRSEFKEALMGGNYVASIVVISTRDYCLWLEKQLRPGWVVGWNLAKGGGGGHFTNGLTGDPCRSNYDTLRKKSKIEGIPICESWLNLDRDEGLVSFCNFYHENKEEGCYLYFHEDAEEFSPETAIFKTLAEYQAEKYRTYDLHGDGVLRNLNELSELCGVKRDTIYARLTARGYNLQQACGIEPPPVMTITVSEVEYPYNGKFTESMIEAIKLDYESGVEYSRISQTHNISQGYLKQMAKEFNFKYPSPGDVEDFMGGTFSLSRRSKLMPEDYLKIKEMLLTIDGCTSYRIGKELGITASAAIKVIKKLKWEEFINGTLD